MKIAGWMILMLMLGAGVLASAEPRPFNQDYFLATHNSYVGGANEGPIEKQLDSGVRFIEYDIYDNDFEQFHDYRIGHSGPGKDLMLGEGNPARPNFGEWLAVIRNWSEKHPGHAPITLGIDVKGGLPGPMLNCKLMQRGLTDNIGFSAGNLVFLNDSLMRAFGKKLYRADEFKGEWPTTDQLRGRILVVLSGDLCTRHEYRWDRGTHPAVAMNAGGQIVEVHDCGAAGLWYWTGRLSRDGSVRWIRHGKYDSGQKPAVTINEDGWVVEVHEAEDGKRLFYQLGKLDEGMEIQWFSRFQGTLFGQGHGPTVLFDGPHGMSLREVHQTDGRNMEESFEIDPAKKRITVSKARASKLALNRVGHAAAEGKWIKVEARADGAAPEDTICFEASSGAKGRIRCEQIMFVEHQKGEDEALLKDGSVFCAAAARAGNVDWAVEQRRAGRVVRLWQLDSMMEAVRRAPIPPANYMATDRPYEAWYREYCQQLGVAK